MVPDMPQLSFWLFLAVIVGLAAWIYRLVSRPGQKPVQLPPAKKTFHQPWGDDKAGGRGNR